MELLEAIRRDIDAIELASIIPPNSDAPSGASILGTLPKDLQKFWWFVRVCYKDLPKKKEDDETIELKLLRIKFNMLNQLFWAMVHLHFNSPKPVICLDKSFQVYYSQPSFRGTY